MSLKYRNQNGVETPVAGLNGTSGELVPSVSMYQTGSFAVPSLPAGGYTNSGVISLPTPFPDTDYIITFDFEHSSLIAGAIQKSASNFKVTIGNIDPDGGTGASTCYWKAYKLMTDESRALDEAAIAALQDNALQYTRLTSGDDIDTLIQPGNYGGYNGEGIGGTFPYSGNSQFSLLVTKAREYRYQLLQAGAELYQRFAGVIDGVIGTWSAWSRYIPESSLTSAVTSGSTAPITSGGVYNIIHHYRWNGTANAPATAAAFAQYCTGEAKVGFTFANCSLDYLPTTSDTYWYVEKMFGSDSIYAILFACVWTEPTELYIGCLNMTTATITWKKVTTAV